MAAHTSELGCLRYPLAGAQLRPSPAPQSRRIGGSSTTTMSSVIRGTMCDITEDDGVSMSSTTSTSRNQGEASVCSSSSSRSRSRSRRNSRAGDDDNIAIAPLCRSSLSSPVTPGLRERGAPAYHEQSSRGVGVEPTHVDGEEEEEKEDVASSPSLSSSSVSSYDLPMERDEVSEGDADEEEEGWEEEEEEEEEEEGVKETVDNIFTLITQEQQDKEMMLFGLEKRGNEIERIGREMAQGAKYDLEQEQQVKERASSNLKTYLGILVQRLETSEGERVKLKGNEHRLSIKLDAARKERALMVEDFSVRIAGAQRQLQLKEMDRLKLSIQHDRLFDAKVQLERKNHYLQAQVSHLSEQLAATADVVISAPAESRVAASARSCVAEAATGATSKATSSTVRLAMGSVGLTASPAQAKSAPAAAVDKGYSPAAIFSTGIKTKSPVTTTRTKTNVSTTITGSTGKAVSSAVPVTTPFRARRPLGTINLNFGGVRAAGAQAPSLAARPVVIKPAVQRGFTGKQGPAIVARPVTKSEGECGPVAREMPSMAGEGEKVEAAPSGRVRRSAEAHSSGGGGEMGAAPSGRVLRSTTRAAAAAAAKKENEAGLSAVSNAVPAGVASPAVPSGSTRHNTRRSMQQRTTTRTTGRDGVKGRGKFMSF